MASSHWCHYGGPFACLPVSLALCLETAALVVLHSTGQAVTDTRLLVEASGCLIAAATAIRERGDRPGPVTLSAAVAAARRAVPPLSGTAPDPAAAADLAIALLAPLGTAH
jgi:hypothetical protein